MSDLKYKLEALLFSSARSMKIEELSNLTKASSEEIREKLEEIKKDYEQRDSSITLIDEGHSFKLNVKSEHMPVIQQIVTETELSKTLMETLAIIAFKYPIKQSDLIKLRTNKAYDHLRELEEMGYIIRQKYSRTKLIKLTPKFFEYFDLPAEKLKEKFADFGGIAKAIKEKEGEVKQMKEEIKKKAEEAGKKKEEPTEKPQESQKSKISEGLETKSQSEIFEEEPKQQTPKETIEEPTEKPLEQPEEETTKEEPVKAAPEAPAEEKPKEENKQDENIPS